MGVARVLIADASPIDRRIIERLVARSTQLEVVGSGPPETILAAPGEPDIVIVEPDAHGALGHDALDRLSGLQASVAVVVFSRTADVGLRWSQGLDGARKVLVVDKAERGQSLATTFDSIVLPWMLAIEPVVRRPKPLASLPQPTLRPQTQELARPTLVRSSQVQADANARPCRQLLLIGASTGGPAAIGDLLRGLPGDLDAAICITQHMPDGFTRSFAERLDTTTPFRVREAGGNELLETGHVWIAPGGRHLEIGQSSQGLVTLLTDAPPENSCRPAVDRLFRTGATVRIEKTLAVVLTGMGRDGLDGARALHATGARVLVQDETSSVVWGMPGAIAREGLADAIEDIPSIAARLVRSLGTTGRPSQWRKLS